MVVLWMVTTWLICVARVTVTSAQTDAATTPAGVMCEKTVRESVPTVIQQTMSYVIRGTKKCGFLWLKTCTTYSMGVRTITKTRYIVKNITISVCCNGTDASGGCMTSKPTCLHGKYGPQCQLDCQCDVNRTLSEVCDDVTGYCYCLDGYGGPGCRQDLNSTGTTEDEYDSRGNHTVVLIPKAKDSEVAGGGDVVSRIVIAVIVVALVFTVVLVFFCCWRHRKRRKGTSGGSTVSDDFVVTLNPTQDTVAIHSADDRAPISAPINVPVSVPEDSTYYVTPEQVRKRKKEQEAGASQESHEKPYDYVEMRNVSGKQPTLSGATSSGNPEVASPSSSFSSSMARRVAERDSEAGRLSMPYANMSPSGSVIQEADTSHYYMGEMGSGAASPTYSMMRRQDSGCSAFDDDGYCTSPTHAADNVNLQYSAPCYVKDNPDRRSRENEKQTENIYDSLTDALVPISVPPRLGKPGDYPEYANVNQASTLPGIYHYIPENQKQPPDGYDRIKLNSSTA